MPQANVQPLDRDHEPAGRPMRQVPDVVLPGLISIDGNDHISGINSAAALLFGVSESAILQLPVTMLLPDFVRKACVDVRAYGMHRGGQRIALDVSISMLRSVESDICVLLLRDAAVANRREHQRRAEEALKESEYNLRVLVDAIPAMLCVTSASGEVEYVNKPVLDLIGCDIEVFRNLGWKSIIHPDDSDDLAERWMAAVKAGVAFKAEYRQRYADGSYRWWQCLVKPLRNEADVIIRWYGVMVDVNDRHETELALRTSEERLREMVDAVPGLLCVCAPNGTLEYVNQPMRELIGHPVDDFGNFGWAGAIHPDDRPALQERWTAAVQSKRLLDCEYRRLTSDGRYRWFHLRMKPQFNEFADISRWYALVTDVDDRIEAEVARRAGEQQLRRVMESIPIGTWCAGPDGEITFINRHLANHKYVDLDQLKRDKYQYLHPEDRRSVRLAWMHSVATGETFSSTHRSRREDGGYRWYQARAKAQRDEHGSVVQWYGYQIDIHDFKSAEDSLRSSQARLARAAKAATVAELSASIAHEINQPLAAIVANGNACQRWLATEPASIDKAKFTAGLVVRDANAAAQIVDRIRALFRRTEPLRVALNVNEVIAEVCELLGDDARRREVFLNLDLAHDLPVALADRTQIQQVVQNLMRNGMEAMESTIDRANVLTIRTFEQDSSVVVQICDEGAGIADLEQIFEPFFTTKATGLGIGLQICRSIVDAHEGRIFAVRNQERGVTFEFRLPAQAGEFL